MAADFKVAQPVEFYKQFLKEDIRPDGRALDEFRETLLNQGSVRNAEGSALVKLGNTTVMCGIKAEIAEPTLREPDVGYLVTNVELPSLSSPRFRPGAPSEQAQILSQFVSNCCKSGMNIARRKMLTWHLHRDKYDGCKIITPKDLCIKEGKACWVLYADILCLNYDGNVIDAAFISLLAALKNTYLPEIKIDNETGSLEMVKGSKAPLKLNAGPVCTSYCVIDDSYLLVDPTDEEESLATGTLNIVVTDDGKLCSVMKPGGTPFEEKWLQKCFSRALTRAEEVRSLITLVKTSPER